MEKDGLCESEWSACIKNECRKFDRFFNLEHRTAKNGFRKSQCFTWLRHHKGYSKRSIENERSKSYRLVKLEYSPTEDGLYSCSCFAWNRYYKGGSKRRVEAKYFCRQIRRVLGHNNNHLWSGNNSGRRFDSSLNHRSYGYVCSNHSV